MAPQDRFCQHQNYICVLDNGIHYWSHGYRNMGIWGQKRPYTILANVFPHVYGIYCCTFYVCFEQGSNKADHCSGKLVHGISISIQNKWTSGTRYGLGQ